MTLNQLALGFGLLFCSTIFISAAQKDPTKGLSGEIAPIVAPTSPHVPSLSPKAAAQLATDPYRGHYVDMSAALFGWLAVIFGLFTLLLSVGAILLSLFGIYKFKDLLSTVEDELKAKVETSFNTRLSEIVADEIKPRVHQIADEELKQVLANVRETAKEELTKAVGGLDSRQKLIDEIVTVLQSRSSSSPSLNQQEFDAS